MRCWSILTSPQFLFLVEESAGPQAEPLSPYELAAKLSYFLWNTSAGCEARQAGQRAGKLGAVCAGGRSTGWWQMSAFSAIYRTSLSPSG